MMKKRKLIAILLSVAMLLTFMPAMAFADTAQTEPPFKLKSGTIWENCEYGGFGDYDYDYDTVDSSDATLVKVTSSNESVISVDRYQDSNSLFDYSLAGEKEGTSTITVTYEYKGATYTTSALYTVKAFPQFVSGITIDGEESDPSDYTGKNYYVIEKYAGTTPSVKISAAEGWSLDGAYGMVVYGEESGKDDEYFDIDVMKAAEGWQFDFPEAAEALYSFYYFYNNKDEEIMLAVHFVREDDQDDEGDQDDPSDMYDLSTYTGTFDDKYLVLDDNPSTPYEDWFYFVPQGTVLEPTVTNGNFTPSSHFFKASYSECMFYEDRNEWDKIDENVWIDHFPTEEGVYFCKVEGLDPFHGTFEWFNLIRIVPKETNTLSAAAKTATVKYSKLKKKAQTLTRSKVIKLSKAQGKVTYKLVSVTKSQFKKYFKVNSKTGKVTIKKGLKKGTYKVKIKVTAAGDEWYKAKSKNVTVKIKVK